MRKHLLALLLCVVGSSDAFADELVDFSDQTVPVCDVMGLRALPPDAWFAVAMQGLPEWLAACQMMRTGLEEELLGVIRLSASATDQSVSEELSRERQLRFEIEVLANMGIVLDLQDPLWRRDDVPLGGARAEEFSSSAQAIGLRAMIVETEQPQEVHMLSFRGPTAQYALVLISPPRFVDAEVYQRNTADFARVIQTLVAPEQDES